MEFFQVPTTFDYSQEVNTLTRMRALGKLALVRSQTVGHLTIFKYSTSAFYNKECWSKHPDLLEARGLVLGLDGNPVNNPFRRVFNWKERGEVDDLPLDKVVRPVIKLNGFLLMAFLNPYTKDVAFACSGTLEGDYVSLGVNSVKEARMRGLIRDYVIGTGNTMMFEIIDSANDPHIVTYDKGMQGPHLIGIGYKSGGYMSAEDVHGCFPEFNPAKSLPPMPFQDLLTLVKSDRGEGYMVQDVDTDEYLVKLKSPYYLTLKLLSRGNPEFMFNNPPEFKRKMLKEGSEELSFLVDEITSSFTLDDWKGMNSDYKMYFIQGLV